MKSLLYLTAIASALLMPTLVSAQEASKSLVAYYSWDDSTRYAAQIIASATNSDLFEIVPQKAYPTDLKACVEQSKAENEANIHPAINDLPPNIAQYNKIYIGSPNWWKTMAPPVATFIEKVGSFEGKTVFPFVTHGTGGVQNYENDVRTMVDGAKGKTGVAGHWFGDDIKKLDDEIIEWANNTK